MLKNTPHLFEHENFEMNLTDGMIDKDILEYSEFESLEISIPARFLLEDQL